MGKILIMKFSLVGSARMLRHSIQAEILALESTLSWSITFQAKYTPGWASPATPEPAMRLQSVWIACPSPLLTWSRGHTT
ncbi:hypothetical protein VN97_g9949 [Penicillium thymicola]|uniref:Uncharacterized protein n=1 Tax=Penicillium thymicola TaxID=293382 RepID=A0AAI9TA92_PENTH|nr:hypothetical protein VN97_g9949 [Penicillium thymicola]